MAWRLILALLITAGVAAELGAQQPGDVVVVAQDGAKLELPGRDAVKLQRGHVLRVQSARGEWLFVRDEKSGWIHRRQVMSRSQAAAERFMQAVAAYRDGSYQRALDLFTETIGLDEEARFAYNNRAWILATCPDERLRDPRAALRDAEFAAELTRHQHHECLSTLAAAYAANEQFEEALRWQRAAIQLAPERDKSELQSRLTLFASKQPLTDDQPAGSVAADAQP